MRSLFIINEGMKVSQIEQSYLLILAMLNFEHEVMVVFLGNTYAQIIQDDQSKKKWSALTLYGIKGLYQYTETEGHTDLHLEQINTIKFQQLKDQADFMS